MCACVSLRCRHQNGCALYANKGETFAIAKFNFLNFILKAHLSTFMGVFTDNFITSYHYSNSHFYITNRGEHTQSMALVYGCVSWTCYLVLLTWRQRRQQMYVCLVHKFNLQFYRMVAGYHCGVGLGETLSTHQHTPSSNWNNFITTDREYSLRRQATTANLDGRWKILTFSGSSFRLFGNTLQVFVYELRCMWAVHVGL